ncbi:CMRF35-like molecule 7 [Galemys pyrenaicus]|uniref:CMRF35-like molecule 7 n=1 Tax=Galemys pyrenaicus TaxID=202257 RepID=A0A8J5ZN74_GALPY|nr:CMRF35-like molecule 7 [Galemys pyrenaicus]
MCVPGSSAVKGPDAVQGWERGSLTVECRYDPGYEANVKWWCRGASWKYCEILVQTTGSEQEVKRGHMSIRDHQKDRTFTVTMEELTMNDADTYWCGIERTGFDVGDQVEVTVNPVSTTTATTTTSTNVPTAAPVSPEEGTGPPNGPSSSSQFSSVPFWLPVLLKGPLLLSLLSAILWGAVADTVLLSEESLHERWPCLALPRPSQQTPCPAPALSLQGQAQPLT